jgi:hypothetical protein
MVQVVFHSNTFFQQNINYSVEFAFFVNVSNAIVIEYKTGTYIKSYCLRIIACQLGQLSPRWRSGSVLAMEKSVLMFSRIEEKNEESAVLP